MKIDNLTSDNAVLQEIGERVSRHRLNKNLTQAQLADMAGVSLSTVNRMEAGHSSQIANLVRVLRALDLLSNIDALIPEPGVSPIQRLEMAGKQRQRARPKKATSTSSGENPGSRSDSNSANTESDMQDFMRGFQSARLAQYKNLLASSSALTKQARDMRNKLGRLRQQYPLLDGNTTEQLNRYEQSLTLTFTEQERLANAFNSQQAAGDSTSFDETSLDLEKLGAIQWQLKNDIDKAKRLTKQIENNEKPN